MSTVRMARYLVHEIRRRFEENFDKAYPEKEIPTTVGDKLYQELIGNKLPKVKDVLEEQFGEQITVSDLFIKTSWLKLKVPVYLKERHWNTEKQVYEYTDELNEEHRVSVNLSNEKLFPRDPKGYRDDPAVMKMTGNENVHIQDVIKFVQYESKREAKREEENDNDSSEEAASEEENDSDSDSAENLFGAADASKIDEESEDSGIITDMWQNEDFDLFEQYWAKAGLDNLEGTPPHKGKFKDYLAKKQQRSQKTAQRTKQ